MKHNHTDITIVLDRSGSMANVLDDTIGGFNRLLDDQKKEPGSASITLHQFDNVYETVIKGKDIKAAQPLTTKTFVPRGSTALIDAIGRSITDTGARLQAIPEQDRPAKVVVVIITDGQENASHEFQSQKVFEMIKHQKEKYNWEFVFLGSDQAGIQTAVNLGMNPGNIMKTAANAIGTQSMYSATSDNLRKFRSGQCATMAYSAKDREDQKKAGA